MKNAQTLTFKNGLKDGLPIGLGYLSVSFAFGVQASLYGIPFYITLLTSMTNLTSAGQLAGISIIAVLGSFAEIMLTQLVINSRYFLMGVSLTQKMDSSFTVGKRLLLAPFITDEIFAVAVSHKEQINTKYFFALSVLPYCGWTIGTLLGALAGDVLPVKIQAALGIALYAMFIAIIIPPAKKSKSVLFTVGISADLSCLFYFVPFLREHVSKGIAIVICALATSIIAALIFPIKEDELTEDNRTNEDQILAEEGEKNE
ncbi:MAG: AzlC family ABC transporter permease [Clostridia bacterium]|nr:AzlC family ABC transporter permease [Clostridia bacterium]